jgi:hypothetical protein
MSIYEELGSRVGALVDVKNKAYGSSFHICGEFLKLLYPNGIKPEQYGDALALVRIFDKMVRIATDKDALGESPYQDIAGYGLLGLDRAETERRKQSLKMALEYLEQLKFGPKTTEAGLEMLKEMELVNGDQGYYPYAIDANGTPVSK